MRWLLTSISLLTIYFGAFAQLGVWTWMKGGANGAYSYGTMGVPAATNEPRARYAAGNWVDTAGCFWVYGGGNSSQFSDLWKFDPTTLMWTWMNGPAGVGNDPVIDGAKGVYTPLNQPGGLSWGMNTWVTANNHFWIFGGSFKVATITTYGNTTLQLTSGPGWAILVT